MKKMKRFWKQFQYGEKGFTLIELLVVVAILGIIAAVAVPNIANFIGTGTEEAASTELHNVQLAVVAYQAENDGDLPTDTAFPVAGEMDDYFIGGVAALQGTYTLNATTGAVTQDTYPGLD